MEDAVKIVQVKLNEAIKEVEKLEYKLSNAQNEVERLKKALRAAIDREEKYNLQLKEANKTVQNSTKKLEAANKEIETLKENLDNAEAEVSERQRSYDEAKNVVDEGERKLQELTAGAYGLEEDDQVPILVKVWWRALKDEPEEPYVRELYRKLSESYGVIGKQVDKRENEQEREKAELDGGEYEQWLQEDKTGFHQQVRESLMGLVDYWSNWINAHDYEDWSDIAQNEKDIIAIEFDSWDKESENLQAKTLGERSGQWLEWIGEVIEEEQKTGLSDLDPKLLLERFQNFLRLMKTRIELNKSQKKAARAETDLIKTEEDKNNLTSALNSATNSLAQVQSDLAMAVEHKKTTLEELDKATRKKKELEIDFASAKEVVNTMEELLETQIVEKNKLVSHLNRVEAIRKEFNKVAHNYKKQFIHYGDTKAHFVHLLDGGVADNLGFTSLLEILEGFEKLKEREVDNVFILAVNARTEPTNRFASQRESPGVVDTIRTITGTAIDGKSFLLERELDRTTEQLLADKVIKNRYMVYVDFEKISEYGNSKDKYFDTHGYENDGINADATLSTTDGHLVTKGMEKTNDILQECQSRFQRIQTNWRLEQQDVEALVNMGELLVRESPEYKRWIETVGGNVEPRTDTILSICTRYLKMADE